MVTIHEVIYDENGIIGSIGSIHPGYAPLDPPPGVLYTTEIPDDPDILSHYKIQNGVFVYDPVPVETEPAVQDDVTELWAAQNDTDALAVDQEYRLTLLELGV